MVLTPSTMAQLGTRAPDFLLPDVASGRARRRDDVRGAKGLLVMFICRHCPFVKHVQGELAALARAYEGRGLGIVGISSNDAERHPDDAPESLKQQAEEIGFPFPYLYDESQDVARAYGAACTPDFFLYDGELRLVYRGQLDDSRPGNGRPVDGRDLRAAIDAVLAGRPVPVDQKPSIGCNIKWRGSGGPSTPRP
jgi:peroxiredoxin